MLRVMLDANVFVSTWTLDVLLTMADEGLLRPFWSTKVLEEFGRAMRRLVEDKRRPPRPIAMEVEGLRKRGLVRFASWLEECFG